MTQSSPVARFISGLGNGRINQVTSWLTRCAISRSSLRFSLMKLVEQTRTTMTSKSPQPYFQKRRLTQFARERLANDDRDPRGDAAQHGAASDASGCAAVAGELSAVRRPLAMSLKSYRVSAGAVLLIAASAFGWLMLRRSAPVSVVVVNASQREIAWVRVEHEKGVEKLGTLRAGGSGVVRFRTPGETSYRLRVRFGDGAEISGGGNYAEPGYSFTDTITDSAIRNELRGMQY